ncbi:glycosylhydrolase-like jelly roll fold domain-containing protein [Paenibacillus sp. strain BS8-2]
MKTLEQQFADPGAEFRPQPFWFLNHEFEEEELLRQINEMHTKGVGGVVLHSRHGKKETYMSQAYLEMLAFCIEACKQRGMQVWLYDEDNWPSGTFGGKLTRSHPEYRMRYLRIEEKRAVYKDAASAEIALDFAEFAGNALIALLAYRVKEQHVDGALILEERAEDLTDRLGEIWRPTTPGHYIILACWECEVAEGVTFGNGYYLDTMNEEAVESFVQLAYDPFDRYQAEFGSTIQGVFTDEPGLMIHDGFFGVEAYRTNVEHPTCNLPGVTFAWTRGALQKFESDHGYGLKSVLGALLYQVGDRSHGIREHYYNSLAEWYRKAYHTALSAWCGKRGLRYIGHTLEEPLWGQARSQGNQTMVLREFDYPGVDYLTPGIGTKENPHRILSVKCAASVAQLEGKQRVVCEAFGASDHAYSMRDRRLDANFMAFLGVNLFIPHAFYYSFAGYRKTDFPPTEFFHAPHWEHYKTFADYIGRLSLMGTTGKRNAGVLLFSPIHTVYQEMFEDGKSVRQPQADVTFTLLSDRLLRNQVDYDYMDELQLEEAEVTEDGALIFPRSHARYTAMILPAMSAISVQSAAKLSVFVKKGGLLIAVGQLPKHSLERREDPAILDFFDELFSESDGDVDAIPMDSRTTKGRTMFFPQEEILGGDATLLCAFLKDWEASKHCDQHVQGLRFKSPEGRQEDLIVTRRAYGGGSFVWLMNWSKEPLVIALDSLGQHTKLVEWRLKDGSVTALSHEEAKGFLLEAGELRIVHTAIHENDANMLAIAEAQEEPNTLATEWGASARSALKQRLQLGGEWRFQAEEPNVRILDRWEVVLNDREARLQARMPGQVNSYRTRLEVSEEGVITGDIRLVIDDLDQNIPSHIGFLSRRRNVEIFVNGHKLPALRETKWQDRFYREADIGTYLQEGVNEIEILCLSLLETMPAMTFPAFVIGDFSLDPAGRLELPKSIIQGDWTLEGYPYYAGKASYMQSFDWNITAQDAAGDRFYLELDEVRETAEAWLNGCPLGVCLWQPYRWELTGALRQGSNTLRIQTANTLENLYGKQSLPSGIIGGCQILIQKEG